MATPARLRSGSRYISRFPTRPTTKSVISRRDVVSALSSETCRGARVGSVTRPVAYWKVTAKHQRSGLQVPTGPTPGSSCSSTLGEGTAGRTQAPRRRRSGAGPAGAATRSTAFAVLTCGPGVSVGRGILGQSQESGWPLPSAHCPRVVGGLAGVHPFRTQPVTWTRSGETVTATETDTIAAQRMVLARLRIRLGCMANAFMASAPFCGYPRSAVAFRSHARP